MNLKSKKNLTVILMLILCIVCTGCNTGTINADETNNASVSKSETKASKNSYSKIKFSEMYETTDNEKDVSKTFKAYDGKKVELNGYMAVQSPLDESFIYLVNQPYVSCPFCAIGDITKLEVIQVLMADGSTISYRETGVTIYGTLEVSAKVDSEGYTTQVRIYADKITELNDENVDKEMQNYYSNLSKAGMIIDIQTLQMNIEYDTNPEYMNESGTTKSEIVDAIANYYQGIGDYLNYIKECPDIVKNCEPQREDLVEMNNELIDLYNDQIKVLEKFTAIILEAQVEGITDAQKEAIYDKLVKLNAENLKMYNAFTVWDNKLRQ